MHRRGLRQRRHLLRGHVGGADALHRALEAGKRPLQRGQTVVGRERRLGDLAVHNLLAQAHLDVDAVDLFRLARLLHAHRAHLLVGVLLGFEQGVFDRKLGHFVAPSQQAAKQPSVVFQQGQGRAGDAETETGSGYPFRGVLLCTP